MAEDSLGRGYSIIHTTAQTSSKQMFFSIVSFLVAVVVHSYYYAKQQVLAFFYEAARNVREWREARTRFFRRRKVRYLDQNNETTNCPIHNTHRACYKSNHNLDENTLNSWETNFYKKNNCEPCYKKPNNSTYFNALSYPEDCYNKTNNYELCYKKNVSDECSCYKTNKNNDCPCNKTNNYELCYKKNVSDECSCYKANRRHDDFCYKTENDKTFNNRAQNDGIYYPSVYKLLSLFHSLYLERHDSTKTQAIFMKFVCDSAKLGQAKGKGMTSFMIADVQGGGRLGAYRNVFVPHSSHFVRQIYRPQRSFDALHLSQIPFFTKLSVILGPNNLMCAKTNSIAHKALRGHIMRQIEGPRKTVHVMVKKFFEEYELYQACGCVWTLGEMMERLSRRILLTIYFGPKVMNIFEHIYHVSVTRRIVESLFGLNDLTPIQPSQMKSLLELREEIFTMATQLVYKSPTSSGEHSVLKPGTWLNTLLTLCVYSNPVVAALLEHPPTSKSNRQLSASECLTLVNYAKDLDDADCPARIIKDSINESLFVPLLGFDATATALATTLKLAVQNTRINKIVTEEISQKKMDIKPGNIQTNRENAKNNKTNNNFKYNDNNKSNKGHTRLNSENNKENEHNNRNHKTHKKQHSYPNYSCLKGSGSKPLLSSSNRGRSLSVSSRGRSISSNSSRCRSSSCDRNSRSRDRCFGRRGRSNSCIVMTTTTSTPVTMTTTMTAALTATTTATPTTKLATASTKAMATKRMAGPGVKATAAGKEKKKEKEALILGKLTTDSPYQRKFPSYVEAVAMEALRLAPPAPVIPEVVILPFYIDLCRNNNSNINNKHTDNNNNNKKLYIPKESLIFVPIPILHQKSFPEIKLSGIGQSEFYPKKEITAEDIFPERWSPVDKNGNFYHKRLVEHLPDNCSVNSLEQNGAFATFKAGSRVCPGRRLAITEVLGMMYVLFMNYDVFLTDEDPLHFNYSYDSALERHGANGHIRIVRKP